MLVKSEIDIERNTVWNGLASSDRSIHLYFKKIFDADKTKEYNCLGRMDDDQSALDRALFEALKKEANDSKSDKNVTSSQDLLSVGANPLSLLEKDAKRDDRIARTLFFKLGLISKEKWQSLKKEDDKRNEERSKRISNFGNAILGGLVFGTASSLALPLLGTMFIGSGLPTELLAYLGLALCIGIGCIAGCAMNALLNHITIKDKVKVNSDIPENVSSLSWHLASELSPHYANEVINSADLTQKAHEKMKKNAQKGYESHSSTEVHHLLIECIEEASSKVSAKDEAALLTKYKDTYKESFELTKKDKGATPADLPKKDRDLKDGTVNWAFELAQAHADKGHAQPKMESKHLKKLKIF